MENNPYAPPKARVDEAAPVDGEVVAASTPLYTVHQITVAAFLGSAVAAGWLAASNLKAVGQPIKARRWLWISIAVTIVILGVSMVLPDRFPSIVIPLAIAFGARAAATTEFGWILRDHERAGGDIRSWWKVVGISLLVCAILVAIMVTVLFLYELATVGVSGVS